MSIVTVLDHPMLQHKLTLLRKKETSSKDFRQIAREIALLMTYEMTRDFPLEEVEIETPIYMRTKTNRRYRIKRR